MTNKPHLIYDIEIQKTISPTEGYEHCEGWRDYGNMGIASICTYDYETKSYGVYMNDNLSVFAELVKERVLIGFNNKSFDDNLLRSNNIPVNASFDLLEAVRIASGQQERWRKGYSLKALAGKNLQLGKIGNGALAPILYQDQKYGELINYNLMDVQLTKALFELPVLIDPTNNETLDMNAAWLELGLHRQLNA